MKIETLQLVFNRCVSREEQKRLMTAAEQKAIDVLVEWHNAYLSRNTTPIVTEEAVLDGVYGAWPIFGNLFTRALSPAADGVDWAAVWDTRRLRKMTDEQYRRVEAAVRDIEASCSANVNTHSHARRRRSRAE